MSEQAFQTDVFSTAAGELRITFLGHGSLLFTYRGKRIYVDPFSRVANYATLPKADLILITHDHRDHLDPEALADVRTSATRVVCPEHCLERVPGGTPLRNGERRVVQGVAIEAIPAYNILHLRENGHPFHPRGDGNGYVIDFGDLRVLVAGDTENTPELRTLRGIDVAFLPMNLPYTMTPEMVAEVAAAIRPRILYPYHYGATVTSRLVELLKDHPEIEVRIRNLA
ncbi:MAG: Metal-dependent hydrolase [Candidatus Bipolaricaulis sibiricus]|uniref:Metal-dependent hydrolase n=1 Tax=Bipolaricaulis sibiricus TaxID=2501609 RepID=A0A410FTC2_BIPS1|nr:MAG: Metal-dependent hydrolase [Candidatus Bipolaricaulis sibiricus]